MPQRWVSFLNKLKIICLEIQNVFLIKLHNIFVQNTKYICSNHKIYLLKLRHIVQSLVSLISPKSRLLSLSCVMGRLCVTKKLFCPTVEFLARIYTFEQRPKNPKSSGWLRLTLKNLQDQNCINICRNIPRKLATLYNVRTYLELSDTSSTVWIHFGLSGSIFRRQWTKTFRMDLNLPGIWSILKSTCRWAPFTCAASA